MTAGDDACRAVLLGEVVHRPHRVALDLEAGREREEVERPLVAVHVLRGLARTDLDHLRQVQLVARRVIAEHAVEDAEHRRVRGEMPELARAGEQRTGAARVQAGELVAADRRRAEERLELGADAIHLLLGDDTLDDDAAGLRAAPTRSRRASASRHRPSGRPSPFRTYPRGRRFGDAGNATRRRQAAGRAGPGSGS